MVYLRYNKLAQEAGVLYDKMPINVTQWPLNVRPPDLSLEANIHGADWIYTYLHSFYMDPSRPFGVNNLVLQNTAMSGILVPFQGQQIRVKTEADKKRYIHRDQWYDLLQLQSPGSMTSQEFDATMADVVNFLVYAAEPYQAEQRRLGWWVIGFLIILFVLTYLLKQEYWKDVKK
jgi:ubiquinol-cytochrome c reductase cytochrome c1 subunit